MDSARPVIIGLLSAVIMAIGLLTTGYLLVSGQNQNREISQQIQAERARSVLSGCQALNQRHDDTIHTIDVLIARLPKARQARAKESRANTVLLINALAPKRDCRKVLRQTVGQ